MKRQAIFLRGGDAFDRPEDFYEYLKNRQDIDPFKSRRTWRDWVEWALSEDFQMIAPVMPCKQNADYPAWKIWFERHFEFLRDEPILLIAQSLGGIFIAKYLSENKFPRPIDQLHLVSPVWTSSEGMVGEGIGNFKFDPTGLKNLAAQAEKIWIYASADDPLVPFWHAEKYAAALPSAKFMKFENRGHFSQPAFPEILEEIRRG